MPKQTGLVDLKLPKKSKKELKEAAMPMPAGDSEPRYPYGTRLELDKELIPKLGIESINGGEMVRIVAQGKVTEVRITDTDGSKKPNRIEIQLQKMEVQRDTQAEYEGGFNGKPS